MAKKKTTQSKSAIVDKVTQRIDTEAIKPRSWSSILVEQLGYAALFLVFFVLSVVGINLLGFWLRASGVGAFAGFGIEGIQVLLGALPLGILVFTVFSFALLMAILRHYDISYKHSFLALAALLLISSIGIGAAIVESDVNESIAERVEEGELSALKPLYKNRLDYRHTSNKLIVGRITAIGDDVLTVEAMEEEFTIYLDERTTRLDEERFEVGQRVGLLVTKVGDKLYARATTAPRELKGGTIRIRGKHAPPRR